MNAQHIKSAATLDKIESDFVIERFDDSGYIGVYHDPKFDERLAASLHYPPADSRRPSPIKATRFATKVEAQSVADEMNLQIGKRHIVAAWRGFGEREGYCVAYEDKAAPAGETYYPAGEREKESAGVFRLYCDAARIARNTGGEVVRSGRSLD